MFHCPVCQSENTQSLRMICESGSATTTGGGIGIGSGGTVGLGIGGSKSQSVLAATHNPGPKPVKQEPGGCSVVFALASGGIGLIALADGNPAGVIFLLLGIAGVFYILNAVSKGKEKHKVDLIEWEAKVKRFEKGWLCHRCGHSWMPD